MMFLKSRRLGQGPTVMGNMEMCSKLPFLLSNFYIQNDNVFSIHISSYHIDMILFLSKSL